ncbi:Rab geranylgeranyltransferase [Tilletia horrida]|uniref:Geranylgeranyl transferase type-2 subunit alpha n=1 Tax=Tilletia horrida TaxID=155126 RepID=A0AAN6GYY0_9BASI|nr:Rab geranylgeranyltransferase [Tilletia horrida]
MHGVKRERTTAQAKAARKAKEAARLEAYLAVEAKFFEYRDANVLSHEALDSTTQLLSLNPEFFSAWNYRRAILSHLFKTAAEGQNDTEGEEGQASRTTALLQDDLELTMHALRAHPKVYWIWSHRTWCLEQLPDPKRDGKKWKAELKLAEHMLELDPRNFHGWDYRRFLLLRLSQALDPTSSNAEFPDALPIELLKQELAYTLQKIEANFSNFSAWHHRSKCLPALWEREQTGGQGKAKQRDAEFELIRQAMYTDPSDSSIWIYHRWLIARELEEGPEVGPNRGGPVLQSEVAVIEELLEMEPESKWCLDTLAHYKTLQRAQLTNEGDASRRDELTSHIHKLLTTLISVDPLRQHRYEDWQTSL